MSSSGDVGGGGNRRRRSERLAARFHVEVREKLATWATVTEDVSPRGCRLELRRVLTPGALVQLAFDMGPGAEPLVVHAQVAWVRRSAPEAAGVTFLSAPRQRQGEAEAGSGTWIDRLLAARVRNLADAPATAATTKRSRDAGPDAVIHLPAA